MVVFLLRGLGSFMSEYGMAWTGHRVVFDLRRADDRALLTLPTPYYDAQSSGRLHLEVHLRRRPARRRDLDRDQTAVRGALTIAGTFGYLFWLNWRLTLVTLIVLPFVASVIRYFSRRLRRVARDVQQRTGSIAHVLEEIDRRAPGGQDLRRPARTRGAARLPPPTAAPVDEPSSPPRARRARRSLQFVGACAVGLII